MIVAGVGVVRRANRDEARPMIAVPEPVSAPWRSVAAGQHPRRYVSPHIRAKRTLAIGYTMAAAMVLALGCAPLHVRTAEAPRARAAFASASTYRFLSSAGTESARASMAAPPGAQPDTTSTGRSGAVAALNPAGSQNPILESPIILQLLQQDIQRSLDKRGYRYLSSSADLSFAYYVGVRNRLRVTDYAYGYPFWGWDWRWGSAWGMWPTRQVTRYEQGTTIVDMLDGSGRRLLWRGLTHDASNSHSIDQSRGATRMVVHEEHGGYTTRRRDRGEYAINLIAADRDDDEVEQIYPV